MGTTVVKHTSNRADNPEVMKRGATKMMGAIENIKVALVGFDPTTFGL